MVIPFLVYSGKHRADGVSNRFRKLRCCLAVYSDRDALILTAWAMVVFADGEILRSIVLPDLFSGGDGGRAIHRLQCRVCSRIQVYRL